MTFKQVSVGLGIMALWATSNLEGLQRGWTGVGRKPVAPISRVAPAVASPIRPAAAIVGGSNGIYCTAPGENGNSVHELGYIPAGFRVAVTVEGFTDGFNPAAAVIVATLGERAANNVKVTSFYDNDSGGEGDPRIEFVAPQDGIYLLLVNDFTDTVVGCYRYQVVAQ